jgi:hypothetical protein
MNKPIKRILAGIALAILAGGAYIGFDIWRTVTQLPEAYAAWDSATLVIEYMDTHAGAWPRSWDEVFSAARTLPNDSRGLHGHSTNDLSDIARLVRIDWNANPREMAESRSPAGGIPFRVITRANGSDFPTLWSGAEPNTLVWEYLTRKTSNHRLQNPSHPDATQPDP